MTETTERGRIPEAPCPVVDVASLPDSWLTDDAFRPRTWLAPILAADPEVWVRRLTEIVTTAQVHLSSRKAEGELLRHGTPEWQEYRDRHRRTLLVLTKCQARLRTAKAAQKDARMAATAAESAAWAGQHRFRKAVEAVEAHRAAGMARVFEAAPHDLILWAELDR